MDTTNPFAKKRLTNRHRLMMVNLALTTFTRPDLRQVERDRQDEFLDCIVAAAQVIPKSDMEVLAAYGVALPTIHRVAIPSRLRLPVGTKAFAKPDGTKVEREDMAEFHRYEEPTRELSFSNWTAAEGFLGGNDAFFFVGYGTNYLRVDLPEPVTAPGATYTQKSPDENVADIEVLNISESGLSGNHGTWLAKAQPALVAWLKAQKRRAEEEIKLIRAAVKLIANAKTYGDVLAIWPEVAKLERDLFGDPPVVNTALVALNNEDRALLCNHMSRRGVTSPVCQAAVSPAYAAE